MPRQYIGSSHKNISFSKKDLKTQEILTECATEGHFSLGYMGMNDMDCDYCPQETQCQSFWSNNDKLELKDFLKQFKEIRKGKYKNLMRRKIVTKYLKGLSY